MVKNHSLGKIETWLKIKILVKQIVILQRNHNSGEKWKLWSELKKRSKIAIQEIKIEAWSKILILVKNESFGQKWKYQSKMEILVKNGNCSQKWKFWSKITIPQHRPNLYVGSPTRDRNQKLSQLYDKR